jgi:hypothetical protein
MVKTYSNILSKENIIELLNYHYAVDDRTDSRPDVTSKHPRWNVDSWPQHIVKSVLDKTLDYDYEVEEVIFNQSKISFRLHADSGYDDNAKKGHAVLIPLYCNGTSTTVFFNNYWHGDSTKFSKVELKQFEYTLPNKNGEWQHIEDLRDLLAQSLTDPSALNDFNVDSKFIDSLKYLIEARSNNKISKLDDRCYNYKNVINYRDDIQFDNTLYQQHLSHIPIETLHGLEIDSVVHWHPGNCIVFDRTQLHSAGSGHTEKIGVTVFTRRRQ